jgi:hypothetical protein
MWIQVWGRAACFGPGKIITREVQKNVPGQELYGANGYF